MPESFEFDTYVTFLRKRWRVVAASLVVATVLALAISLLQTRLYSAKVTLLIEPPASSDPRAAMAVSPIYLESLRTYEHFASSDYLFSEAVKKFQLRDGTWRSRSIEDIKKSILHVSIPRNTKVLQIEVTLASAEKALALATYLAGKTVELSRQAGSFTDRELEETAQRELTAADSRLDRAAAELARQLKRRSADKTLEAELERLGERSTEVERLALVASVSSSGEEDREGAGDDASRKGTRPAWGPTSKQAATLRAEVERLNREVGRKRKELVEQRAAVELGNSEYKAALEAREVASRRLQEIRGMAGNRNERISILDPGFLPERPSSPKILLNLIAGAVLGLLFALAFLSAEFSLQRHKADKTRSLPWVVGQL